MDKNMQDENDYFVTKDKQLTPFLLIQKDITFVGTRQSGDILYFQFSPKERCQQLVNLFLSRKAPLIQPKDIMEAIESYRDQIFQMKEKRYGGKTYR